MEVKCTAIYNDVYIYTRTYVYVCIIYIYLHIIKSGMLKCLHISTITHANL